MNEYKKKILRGSVKFVTSLPPPGPGKDFLSRTFLFYMYPDVNLGLPWPGSMECSFSLHHSLPMETLPQEAQEALEPQEANRRRKWKCEPWVPLSNIKEKKSKWLLGGGHFLVKLLLLSPPCFFWSPYPHSPASKPIKTHWFTK